ncbi:TniB family NTP-binding protein [Muricoccus vinaceus]|uniref:TniB family NTP-binding protein n=1 Tax=Muricoccus vinaceus TaxID=424704 RepID=A0ABV6IX57_9PROT
MSEHDFPHLLPAARTVARLPDAERIDWIRSAHWIEHPAASKLLEQLQDYVKRPPCDRKRNVLLYGDSGIGKSQILRRLAFQNQAPDCAAERGMSSLLYVLMPPMPKTFDFLVEINERINAPVCLSHKEVALRGTTIDLLREGNIRGLLIDEINSIFAASPLQQRAFLQLLRFMANKLKITLICAGTPEAKVALMSDGELKSRFRDIEMKRWQDGEALRGFLARLVQNLPLRRPSPVDSPSIRALVLERSAGLTTNIFEAFECAAVAAIQSGREMLDRSSIEDDSAWVDAT